MLLPGPPSGPTTLAGGGGTANTHRLNLNPSGGWTNAAPLPQTRRNLNTVLLPDATLLGVGGNSTAEEGLPQRETLLYTPSTNTWTRLADQGEQRAYHSTALLLPDGRVWSGGDNTASGGGNASDVVEIFSRRTSSAGRARRSRRPRRRSGTAPPSRSAPPERRRAPC